MHLKAVLFDLDGTLVDSTRAHVEAWINAAQSLGIIVAREEVEALMGLSSLDIARSLLQGKGCIESAEHLAALKDEIFMKEMLGEIELIDGALEAVSWVKDKGLLSGVVSMNPARLIIEVLRLKGLLNLIDVIVGSDNVERGKPAPDALLMACELLEVKPDECIYVGDKSYDVLAARNAGMKSVIVGEEVDEADHYLESIAELPSLIRLLVRDQ